MRQTATKIFNTVFTRFNITVFLVLLQAGYFALLVFRLDSYADWATALNRAIGIVCSIYIIWRDYNPAYKISWLFFIGVLPSLGVVSYVIFGGKRPSRRLRKTLAPLDKEHMKDLEQTDDISGLAEPRIRKTCSYIHDYGTFPAWKDTGAKYYSLGDDLYPDLLDDLKKAERFIFLEFFIIGGGEMWGGIESILREKAAAGVDVRVIYDDVGSIKVLPRNFQKNLEAAGIKVITFNPVLPLLTFAYNNRDHRKIVVIDGDLGYTGGFNLADEYINRKKRFGHWKDCGIRLEGNAVWNLTVMFLNMWNAFRKTDDVYDAFRPAGIRTDESLLTETSEVSVTETQADHAALPGIVQPYGDSPLDEEHVGEFVYLDMINQAKDYLYIYTPYLLIDNEMQVALEMAVKRGVRITIVTPHIPDKPLVFAITRSYYEGLVHNKVQVMEYTRGFVHSKVFVADDRMAAVGTINVDFRSFFFHFEDAVFLVDSPCISDIRRDFEETFDICTPVTTNFMNHRILSKIAGVVLRVLAPLM
ncbi:MAG: cardiolipin synthase [Eubacterium sp.]|nr:cardiolipin synthase [Eubacterium sp.]